jgi:hypothetical protein
MISRRTFVAALAMLPLGARAATIAPGRKLDFRVKTPGFGNAGEADIKAVLQSAAGEIWKHCPDTQFHQPGFEIYHNAQYPITHFELSADGRVVIGLAVEGTLWARFTFQFAHEFAHALMDHTNDSSRIWHRLDHANQWLEECLCETASLFGLRAAAKTWKTSPPYPNWRDYAWALDDYARQRMEDPKQQLPRGTDFHTWFAREEASLRKAPTQRDKNVIVAGRLLPLFEAEPRGWEAITFLKLGSRDPEKSLAKHLAEWQDNTPVGQRPFVRRVAAVFGPTTGDRQPVTDNR